VRGGFGGHKNHPEKGRVALPRVFVLPQKKKSQKKISIKLRPKQAHYMNVVM
jgi:hypothetical protein